MAPHKNRTGERAVYTFASLRKAAIYHLDQGKKNPEGCSYAFMAANLSVAFFLEAYLNHLGSQQLPNWDADVERREPKQKLKALAEEVGFSIDYQGAMYQAFTDAFSFRKALVHGRTEYLSGSWNSADAPIHGATPLQTDWEKLCSATVADRLLSQAESLVRGLHRAAGNNEDPFLTLSAGFSRGSPS